MLYLKISILVSYSINKVKFIAVSAICKATQAVFDAVNPNALRSKLKRETKMLKGPFLMRPTKDLYFDLADEMYVNKT